MTLEERLKKLLQTPHKDSMGTTVMTFPTTKLLEQIIQAFKDAHWEPVVVLNRDKSYKATGDKIYKTATLMTREEWEARAKDDGWHKECPPKITDATLYPLLWATRHGYKEGYEWHNELKKELEREDIKYIKIDSEIPRLFSYKQIMKASKRASNISEEEE